MVAHVTMQKQAPPSSKVCFLNMFLIVIVCFFRTFPHSERRMSVFTQQLNPITGKLEWGIQPEDYDYKQEVARSAYADMLHDQERVYYTVLVLMDKLFCIFD